MQVDRICSCGFGLLMFKVELLASQKSSFFNFSGKERVNMTLL